MSTFTLAISCLTTSNLPWFMDMTFQVPMQYCSLQHRILLLSPVTSTAGYCFCFGSIPSFFLGLFLHWSPVAYWAPTDLGSSSFSILPFCLFILFMRSDRMWSTGEGNGRPLQYLCLENPINNMKRQNDRILKEELLRSLSAQYATGDQWRKNSRKNRESQSKNNTQLWMLLVMEARSDAIKSNTA